MDSEEKAPLLVQVPAQAVEGCPGCAMERRKASSNGRIPYKELFFVGVTSLASGTYPSVACMHLHPSLLTNN